MAETDRAFSGRRGQGAGAPFGERRLIVSAPRRGGFVGSKSRVVEVVHVRRDGARQVESRPPSAAWSVRAETWPEGFRAKPTQPFPSNSQPVAPELAPPAVHVMPMWEPSPPQPASPLAEPVELPVELVVAGQHRPGPPKAKSPKEAARRFADPFAEGEDGANCLRCGYLVEPVREKRGLLTCSACG